MKDSFYSKCRTCDFEKLFAKKGYSYFTKGFYNLNIIGVRSYQKNKITNNYNDYLVLIYNTSVGIKRQIYTITTLPGATFMKAPKNIKGTAILAPGQYKGVYKLDKHNNKYDALCQRNGPVKVYRDNNKDNLYDYNPDTLENGNFGINIHRSSEYYTRTTIDGYSAGCQVFNDPSQYTSFINLVRKSAKIYGNKFTYTLINEEDIDEME